MIFAWVIAMWIAAIVGLFLLEAKLEKRGLGNVVRVARTSMIVTSVVGFVLLVGLKRC